MNASNRSWLFCFFLGTALALLIFSGVACKESTKKISSTESPSKSLSPEIEQQQKQQILDWNLATTVKAYEQGGHTSSKWDESAKRALTEFAQLKSKAPGADPKVISTSAAAAMLAGCDDPMVNYLFIKYSMSQTNSKEAFTAAFYKMALDMESSSYPPIRKFYAGFRTVQQYGWANNYPTNWPDEMSSLSHRTTDYLSAVLGVQETPASEIYDACHEYLSNWEKDNETYAKIWDTMEPMVFKYWPNASSSWLLKGEVYIRMAWQARTDETANKVTQEGWKLFRERLAVAENALTNAWLLNPSDPRIADKMIHVELGQGLGRSRMELWFNRAMELDTNNYTACWDKLNYLAPKWYGSYVDMLQFGRECVQNKKWGGQVPLSLVDVHYWIQTCPDCLSKSEQASYWKRLDVWNDIQAAYDRFFEANPNAIGYYHNYASYAYKAEQWDKLNELIPKLGPINYEFFGGKDEYDKMVLLAKEHATKK